MKKLLILFAIVLTGKAAFAQKNFEGEILFRMYSLADNQKDTTTGEGYRVIFGRHAINVQRLNRQGMVWDEKIVMLDSAKMYEVDHRFKTCTQRWKYNPDKKFTNFLPWGMNKATIIDQHKTIAGYKTITNHLITDGQPNNGHVDLEENKTLCFKLPAQITKNLFIDGMLFYDDHIMLAMQVAAGVAPHTQLNYVATKVEAKTIDDAVFKLPQGYEVKVQKPVASH